MEGEAIKPAGTQKQARRPRLTRASDFKPNVEHSKAGRFQLQKRDLTIIEAVARHRFLQTTHLVRLFCCDCPREEKVGRRNGREAVILSKVHRPQCSCTCGVEQRTLDHTEGCPQLFKDELHLGRRIRELYQAGYLERPMSQMELRIQEGRFVKGSVPIVYAVSKKGLDVLPEDRRARLGKGHMSWIRKKEDGTRVFMEHTLAIAGLSVGLDVALRNRPHLSRISEGELLAAMPSEEQREKVRPFGMLGIYDKKSLPAVCDLVFALDDAKQDRQRNVLVEIDLGHMPVARGGLSQTSIMRKIIAYSTAIEARQHADSFGWDNVTVLVLTTSEERVKSCVLACGEFFGDTKIARHFLFGTLDAASDPLRYEYLNGRAEIVRLVE